MAWTEASGDETSPSEAAGCRTPPAACQRGDILAGYNLTAEGDGVSGCSLQSTRVNRDYRGRQCQNWAESAPCTVGLGKGRGPSESLHSITPLRARDRVYRPTATSKAAVRYVHSASVCGVGAPVGAAARPQVLRRSGDRKITERRILCRGRDCHNVCPFRISGANRLLELCLTFPSTDSRQGTGPDQYDRA
jgi:hypothetical protein